jgi:hypothetical protein
MWCSSKIHFTLTLISSINTGWPLASTPNKDSDLWYIDGDCYLSKWSCVVNWNLQDLHFSFRAYFLVSFTQGHSNNWCAECRPGAYRWASKHYSSYHVYAVLRLLWVLSMLTITSVSASLQIDRACDYSRLLQSSHLIWPYNTFIF